MLKESGAFVNYGAIKALLFELFELFFELK